MAPPFDAEDNDVEPASPAVEMTVPEQMKQAWIDEKTVDGGITLEDAQKKAERLESFSPDYWSSEAEAMGWRQKPTGDWYRHEKPEEPEAIVTEADAAKAMERYTGQGVSVRESLDLDTYLKSLEQVRRRVEHYPSDVLEDYKTDPKGVWVTPQQAFDAHAEKLKLDPRDLDVRFLEAGVGRESLEADIMGGMSAKQAMREAQSRGVLAYQGLQTQATEMRSQQVLMEEIQKARERGDTELPGYLLSGMEYVFPEGVTADWAGTDPSKVPLLAKAGEAGFRDSIALLNFYASSDTDEGRAVSQLHGLYSGQADGWGPYIKQRMEAILANKGGTNGASARDLRRAKHQAVHELAMWKTVGQWTAPIFIPWDYLQTGKAGWAEAISPTVELIGYTNPKRGGDREVIFYQTDGLLHGLEMIDVVGSALTGGAEYALGWDTESRDLEEALLTGVMDRKDPLSSSMEHLPQDASILRKTLQIGTGAAFMIGMPDATVGFGASAKVAKRVGDLATAGKITKSHAQTLEQIAEARAMGDWLGMERLEGNLRKVNPDLAQDLDRLDAEVASRLALENDDIVGEGAEELAAQLPGRAGEHAIFSHMSHRKTRKTFTGAGSTKKEMLGTGDLLDELEDLKGRVRAGDSDILTPKLRRAADGDFKNLNKLLKGAKKGVKSKFFNKLENTIGDAWLDDGVTWLKSMSDEVDNLGLTGKNADKIKDELKQTLQNMKGHIENVSKNRLDDLQYVDRAIDAVKVNNESRAIAALHLRNQVRAHFGLKPKPFKPKLKNLVDRAKGIPQLSDEALLFMRNAKKAGWTTEDAYLGARIADARAKAWETETQRSAASWWQTRIAGVRDKDDFIRRFLTDPDSPEGMATTALPDGYILRQTKDGDWFVTDAAGKAVGTPNSDPMDAAASAVDGLIKQGVMKRAPGDTYPTRVDNVIIGHKLDDAEYNIGKQPYEVAVVYGPDGQVMRMTQKAVGSVSFSLADQMKLIRGSNVEPGGFGTMTHNHPGFVGDRITSGFSGADISFAAFNGLKEMRATGAGGSWVLTIDDWGGMSRGVLYRQGDKKAVTGRKKDYPAIAEFEKDLVGSGFGSTSHIQQIINKTFREVRDAGGSEAEAIELFNKRWLGTGEEAWLRQNGLKSLRDILGDHGVSFRVRLEPRVERGRTGQDVQQNFTRLAREARDRRPVDLLFQRREATFRGQAPAETSPKPRDVDSPEFKKWSGGAPVVKPGDEIPDGPVVLEVFHGAPSEVGRAGDDFAGLSPQEKARSPLRGGMAESRSMGPAIYGTRDIKTATEYAGDLSYLKRTAEDVGGYRPSRGAARTPTGEAMEEGLRETLIRDPDMWGRPEGGSSGRELPGARGAVPIHHLYVKLESPLNLNKPLASVTEKELKNIRNMVEEILERQVQHGRKLDIEDPSTTAGRGWEESARSNKEYYIGAIDNQKPISGWDDGAELTLGNLFSEDGLLSVATDVSDIFKKYGYDGVISNPKIQVDEIIVFKTEQTKSKFLRQDVGPPKARALGQPVVFRQAGQGTGAPGLERLNRPNKMYRGMTETEYKATVGKDGRIESRQDWSVPGEGTSFGEGIETADSYVNFGRTDPRKTGRPTYIVETSRGDLKPGRDGYLKSQSPTPAERVWKIEAVDDSLVGRLISQPETLGAAEPPPLPPKAAPPPLPKLDMAALERGAPKREKLPSPPPDAPPRPYRDEFSTQNRPLDPELPGHPPEVLHEQLHQFDARITPEARLTDALDWFSRHGVHPATRSLSQRLKPLVDEDTLFFIQDEAGTLAAESIEAGGFLSVKEFRSAHYSSGRGFTHTPPSVVLKGKGQEATALNDQVFLHEALHAATSKIVDRPPDAATQKVVDELVDFTQTVKAECVKIRDRLEAKMRDASPRGDVNYEDLTDLTDIEVMQLTIAEHLLNPDVIGGDVKRAAKELITYSMVHPGVREFLESIPITKVLKPGEKPRSLYDSLVEFVGRLVNGGKKLPVEEESALHRALLLSEDVLKEAERHADTAVQAQKRIVASGIKGDLDPYRQAIDEHRKSLYRRGNTDIASMTTDYQGMVGHALSFLETSIRNGQKTLTAEGAVLKELQYFDDWINGLRQRLAGELHPVEAGPLFKHLDDMKEQNRILRENIKIGYGDKIPVDVPLPKPDLKQPGKLTVAQQMLARHEWSEQQAFHLTYLDKKAHKLDAPDIEGLYGNRKIVGELLSELSEMVLRGDKTVFIERRIVKALDKFNTRIDDFIEDSRTIADDPEFLKRLEALKAANTEHRDIMQKGFETLREYDPRRPLGAADDITPAQRAEALYQQGRGESALAEAAEAQAGESRIWDEFGRRSLQAHEALQGTVDNILRDPVVGPRLKAWFRESTITTRDGKTPLVVFHGTSAEKDFDAFDPTAVREHSLSEGFGAHFGTLPAASRFLWMPPDDAVNAAVFPRAANASGARVIPAFVRLENPVYLPDLGGWEPGDVIAALRGEKASGTDMHAFGLELEVLVDDGLMSLSQMEKSLAKFDEQVEVLKRAGIDEFAELIEEELFHHALDVTRLNMTDAQRAAAVEATKALHAKIHRFLESAGFDGARYRAMPESGQHIGEAGVHDAFVIFKPQQAKGIYGSKYTEDARLMFQEQDAMLKAATEFTEDGRAYIYALEEPNVSSLVHELGHVFRRDLNVDDMDTVSAWLKAEHGLGVTHEANRFVGTADEVERAEELFAEAFEVYIKEGKTPVSTLEKVFEKLKTMMVQIYKHVAGPDVKMTDEMRDVFDRLLMESGPTEELFPTAKKMVTNQLLGPPEERVIGVMGYVAEEARRLGIKGKSVKNITEELDRTGQVTLPKSIMFERAGIGKVTDDGEYILTREHLTKLQDELEQEAFMAQVAQEPDLGLLSKGHRTKSTEVSPDERLKNWLEGDPTDSLPGSLGKKMGRFTATCIFGGDPLRGTGFDEPLRLFPDHMRKTIMAGVRRVEHGTGETIRLVAEGDWGRLVRYLGGETVNFKISGRPATSSGVDAINVVFGNLQRNMSKGDNALRTTQLQKMADLVDPTSKRKFEAGWNELLNHPEKADIEEAFEHFLKMGGKGNDIPEFVKDLRRAMGVTPTIEPENVKRIESLLFHAGVTSRGDKFITDTVKTSADVATSLLKEIEALAGKDKAARVAVLLATHGHAGQARNMWARMGVGISQRDKELWIRWFNGDYIQPKDMPRIKQLSRTHGMKPEWLNDAAILDIDFFVPAAARDRMADALAKGSEGMKGEAFWLQSEQNMDNLMGMAIRFQKLRMTRGNFVLRQRYFFMNTFDHFNQMAMTVGFRPAAASTARLLMQDVMVLPGVARFIYVVQKTGLLKPDAAEKLRRGLQKAGDKAAHAVATFFGGAKYRMEVNPILNGVEGSFMFRGRGPGVPSKSYSYREIRNIAVEEGIFASFDTTQLKGAIKRTRNLAKEQFLKTTEASVKAGDLPAAAMGKARDALVDVMQMTSDTAEAWAERERLGAMVTLMEAGIPPRAAARMTIDALYDYAGTMTRFDRSWMMTMVFPFWAFQKNANKQIFNQLFSPWGAYRMSVLRHAEEAGVDVLNYVLWSSIADPYGMSAEDLHNLEKDPQKSANYWAARQALEFGVGPLENLGVQEQNVIADMVWGAADQPMTEDGKVDWSQLDPDSRRLFEKGYGGPQNVPEDARRALFMLVTDQDEMVEGGGAWSLNHLLRKTEAPMDLSTGLGEYALPRNRGRGPRPSYLKSRLGIQIPYASTERTRAYYNAMSKFNPEHPYTELFLPESTIHAGMRHILGVLNTELTVAEAALSLGGAKALFGPSEDDPRGWEKPSTEWIDQALEEGSFDPSQPYVTEKGSTHEMFEPLMSKLARDQFQQNLRSVFELERSPFLGPVFAELGMEGGGVRRVHPSLADLVESTFGVHLLRLDPKQYADWEEDLAELEKTDPQQAAEFRALAAITSGDEAVVTMQEERVYMFPGAWQYLFELTLGEVNAMLLAQGKVRHDPRLYGQTPLESVGGARGETIRALRLALQVQTEEIYPSKTAGREQTRFKSTTTRPPTE